MDDELIKKPPGAYRANFLWPHDDDSVEEAGYEFANAGTREYQQQWWEILIQRVQLRAASLLRRTGPAPAGLEILNRYDQLLSTWMGDHPGCVPGKPIKDAFKDQALCKSLSTTSKTSTPASSPKKRAKRPSR